MKYTGYHGTKKENQQSILENGYKISTSSYHHWLGNGIYFWADEYYAVEWNIIDLEKSGNVTQRNLIKNYVIFEATLDVKNNKVINLSSPKGSILFERFKQEVFASSNKEQKEKLKNIEDDVFWINFMSKKGLFKSYDIVIANYEKWIKDNNKHTGDFLKYEQTQICVKNKKTIIENIVYDNYNEIKALYNTIRLNRKSKEAVLK